MKNITLILFCLFVSNVMAQSNNPDVQNQEPKFSKEQIEKLQANMNKIEQLREEINQLFKEIYSLEKQIDAAIKLQESGQIACVVLQDLANKIEQLSVAFPKDKKTESELKDYTAAYNTQKNKLIERRISCNLKNF